MIVQVEQSSVYDLSWFWEKSSVIINKVDFHTITRGSRYILREVENVADKIGIMDL